MPYKRGKLVAVALHEIKPGDVIYMGGKKFGVSRIDYTPNKPVLTFDGHRRTDVVVLYARPWLQWKGYLKTCEMVALCAGQCTHGGMHIVTRADQDHTTVRPPKRISLLVDKYNRAPFIKMERKAK